MYLNPGETSLILCVDQPGFRLNTLAFARTARPPTVYRATRAARAGVAEIENGGGSVGRGAIRNLGRIGTSLTWGVCAPGAGQAALRLKYRNTTGKALPFELPIGGKAAMPLTIGPTGDTWRNLDVTVWLEAGANRVQLSGLVNGWDSISLEQLDQITPTTATSPGR